MADQKRWFKLWCSAPGDDDLQLLPPDLRWAWAAFGCHTKLHGTRGRVRVSPTNRVLAAEMGVAMEALRDTIARLPHLHIEEGISANGRFTVTWQNWKKYQEDSTVAERVSRLRSKRRGEEKRGEEKRTPPLTPPQPISSFQLRGPLLEALEKAPVLGRLRSTAWWQAEVRANPGVNFATEVLKAEAWMQANPTKAPRKDFRRFLHTWLARANRETEDGD